MKKYLRVKGGLVIVDGDKTDVWLITTESSVKEGSTFAKDIEEGVKKLANLHLTKDGI